VIRFRDLRPQHRELREEIREALDRVLESGIFALGPEVAAFEEAFAAYCGATSAIGVASGTRALELALTGLGVGEGDEVITVPNSFVATAAAIRSVGARPVFVDVEPGTLTLDARGLAAACSDRTRAVLPVHLYGHPASMEPIVAFARERGLAVIEDAAQAHGAREGGRPVGSLGDAGCFSFYPTKNLGAIGEAGAITVCDLERDAAIRPLREWQGSAGNNARMDALQAAVLGVKLRHLEAWTEARRERAALYDRLLAATPARTPVERDGCRHVYHLYVVRVEGRDAVAKAMAESGVETGIHYPRPLHLDPRFADLGYTEGDFPVAEAAAREVLSLPLDPAHSEATTEAVASALLRALARG